MSLKVRFLARDKAKAKELIERYEDVPAQVRGLLTAFIDALEDDAPIDGGVTRVIEVSAECSTDDDDKKLAHAFVTYRLVL